MSETKPQPANGGEARGVRGSQRLLIASSAALGLGLLVWAVVTQVGRERTDPVPVPPEKPAAQAPDAYPLGDVSEWLPQVQSLRLRTEVRFDSDADAIARSRAQLASEFPDLKDPDPLQFTGLLPVLYEDEEWAFDRSRLRHVSVRRTEDGRQLSRDLRLWDGKRAVLRSQYFVSKQDGFRLAPTPERVAEIAPGLSYLARQPPVCWWNATPDTKREYERTQGTPADYVRVGQEVYHGVECHVLLCAAGNQSDRFYVGVADGRWYGAKEGISAVPAEVARAERLAVEEFLGTKLGDDAAADAWDKVRETLDSLPRERKAAWCRLHYARVARHYTPVFEYWFSDFRDLDNGRAFPFREEFLLYDHEGQEKTFVQTKRTVTVKELALGRPLADDLFQEPLAEGVSVVDETHQPPLRYKHKAKFTDEEWRAIVQKATDEAGQDADRRRRVEQLIGKPAPPLPAGAWLNSGRLTWADLRGKIVVLKFWHVACVPCYQELGVLSGTEDGGRPPIVFIGVHAPGVSRADVEEVVKKHKLGAPICIDEKGDGQATVGRFFGGCEVSAMPTSVAVDEEGRILAHGSLSEVLAAVQQRRNKAP